MDGFEIIHKIGQGAFSKVFKVRRKADNNIYALKKVKLKNLKEKEKESALNEVSILASIKHPYIIGYKEAFIEEKDESLCIVMEYANNGDLYQRICQFRKMNYFMEESDIWRIFIQLVKGLKSLHDLNILHRDLKSANIFLFNNGTAKIGDCNVSKILKHDLGHTQTGTPYYAAPEVWNEDPYDNKSDIWSLGVILYEMLTLSPPFHGNNMDELYNKICEGRIRRISNKYSNDIFTIVKLLLRVNPDERPSCDEIVNNKIVYERIDFFKDREGFKNENGLNLEDSKLMKTLRVTKDLFFLSKQLPLPNYNPSNKVSTSTKKENHPKRNNSTLPDIIHNIGTSEEKKNLIKNKEIIENYTNNNRFNLKLETSKNEYIKTENSISPQNALESNTKINISKKFFKSNLYTSPTQLDKKKLKEQRIKNTEEKNKYYLNKLLVGSKKNIYQLNENKRYNLRIKSNRNANKNLIYLPKIKNYKINSSSNNKGRNKK